MLNKLNELRKGKEEGFTLIELLVVILIIGVLSAIALPIFLNQQKEALKAGVKSDVRNTVTNVSTYLVSNPSATKTQMTTAGNITLVASKDDTITIVAPVTGYSDWGVNGTNAGVSNWGYQFNSVKGTYAENAGTFDAAK